MTVEKSETFRDTETYINKIEPIFFCDTPLVEPNFLEVFLTLGTLKTLQLYIPSTAVFLKYLSTKNGILIAIRLI